MRVLLVAAPIVALGCLGPSERPVAERAGDAPPVSISTTLDRATVAATDEVAGTIHFEFHAPPRESAEGATAWCADTTWRIELANESAPLLDLVVEGDPDAPYLSRILSEDRVADYRFRIVPCPEFAERSSASAVPLRRFDVGNHAMRIVFDARDPGGWRMASQGAPNGRRLEPLVGSFTSRWTTFDVVDAGRPFDSDDLAAIVLSGNETRAADVFAVEGPRLLAPESMVALIARAEGDRRGLLAEAFVRALSSSSSSKWWYNESWPAFRALFTEIGDSGLDCTSHEAPKFIARIALGRVVPLRHGSIDTCTFKMLRVDGGGVTKSFVLPRIGSADTQRVVETPGLFRITCDVHPRIWGWLLVE
jgi:hypothetical protein